MEHAGCDCVSSDFDVTSSGVEIGVVDEKSAERHDYITRVSKVAIVFHCVVAKITSTNDSTNTSRRKNPSSLEKFFKKEERVNFLTFPTEVPEISASVAFHKKESVIVTVNAV